MKEKKTRKKLGKNCSNQGNKISESYLVRKKRTKSAPRGGGQEETKRKQKQKRNDSLSIKQTETR